MLDNLHVILYLQGQIKPASITRQSLVCHLVAKICKTLVAFSFQSDPTNDWHIMTALQSRRCCWAHTLVVLWYIFRWNPHTTIGVFVVLDIIVVLSWSIKGSRKTISDHSCLVWIVMNVLKHEGRKCQIFLRLATMLLPGRQMSVSWIVFSCAPTRTLLGPNRVRSGVIVIFASIGNLHESCDVLLPFYRWLQTALS